MFSHLFTVLMAVYSKDDPYLFNIALGSIFDNNIRPCSIVVVCDGPLSSELEKILNNYRLHKELVILRLPKNQGLACALNFGIRHIQTKYIIRADADDFNYPSRFAILIEQLEKKSHDLVGSYILEVDKFFNSIAIRRVPLIASDIKKYCKKRNPFNHMAVAFRTDLVKSVGGYPNLYLREDYGLWALMISSGAVCSNIPEVLVRATAGQEMYKRRGGIKYAMAEYHLQKMLVSCRLKNGFQAISDGCLRAIIFLLPVKFREFIYISLLRSIK